jgi:ribonuclease G
MNKELFVSTTPHETKVGITEDDQLAEIYLERENEYTLAGSIYKGRVTRVLPGMQSAFVDIGLERDAFLYVSDFMDLEQQDEDLDEAIPANRPVMEARPRNGVEAGGPAMNGDGQLAEARSGANEGEEPEAASPEGGGGTGVARDFRGRRRRRGRRGEIGRGPSAERGERPERSEVRSEPRGEIRSEIRSEVRNETGGETRSEPRNESRSESRNDRSNRGDRPGRSGSDSRFQRPAPSTARAGRDYDYGPPPGYQPILLPGESISKYQRQGLGQGQAPALPAESVAAERSAPALAPGSIVANFPEDEPMFAAEVAEPLHEQHEHVPDAEVAEEVQGTISTAVPAAEDWQVRDEVQSVIGTDSAPATTVHETQHEADFAATPQVARDVIDAVPHDVPHHVPHEVTHGDVEEQEIEEEEADLASYGEEPGDDEGFEELEEETRAAGGELSGPGVGEITPGLAAGSEAAATGEAVPESVLEAEEREAEELELEEAQAEAEALLEAEAIGDGTVDASAEVRGPAPEARLLQRTQRRAPERGFDRGRGRRGARRFRSR